MLTRKHYKSIASILNKAIKEGDDKINTINIILNEFTLYFKQDNIKFNREKFIDAVLK